MTEPIVQPMKYMVNCVPETVESYYHWAIYVEYRGKDEWVITDGFSPSSLADKDGEFTYMPGIPDEQLTDAEYGHYARINQEWSAAHRFPLEQALDIARKVAPGRTVGPYTPADAIERFTKER